MAIFKNLTITTFGHNKGNVSCTGFVYSHNGKETDFFVSYVYYGYGWSRVRFPLGSTMFVY